MPRVMSRFSPALRDRLIELRRALHADPELAFAEHRTADRLEEALVALGGSDARRITETGLLLRIRGADPTAPVIAIRGDIDALPVNEESGLPFASRTPGVMHACGHDVHATWAVGAAALLMESPADGDVVVLLQPAEESGGGAARMIEGGALEGVAMIFGGHVDRRFAMGQVVADAGPLAASADTFEVVVTGRGAHAARPHESRDPIVAAAAIVGALQQVVSRGVDPSDTAVLTVATMHAGTASNVIPERAVLTGTVRAIRPATRTRLRGELDQVVAGVAAAHGVSAAVTYSDDTPPVINDAAAAELARRAASALLGDDAVVPLGFLNMASEDFAHYLERIPGCFLRIGAREPGGEATPAHNPRFVPAEEAIFVGAAVLAEAARVASRELRAGREA
jgi:hippurate hydrolase